MSLKDQWVTRLTPDPINPSHYKSGGLEAIQVIEAFELDYNLGNAVKYLLRCGKKGPPIEDLHKCAWYVQRAIDNATKGA